MMTEMFEGMQAQTRGGGRPPAAFAGRIGPVVPSRPKWPPADSSEMGTPALVGAS